MRALARNTDPDTSWMASEAIQTSGTVELQREQALQAVQAYPGLTSRELAQVTGLPHEMLHKRLPELTTLVQGEAREKRKCSISGNRCVTWQLRRDGLQ